MANVKVFADRDVQAKTILTQYFDTVASENNFVLARPLLSFV
jgi:hypothetical protein